MKMILLIFLLISGTNIVAQSIAKIPDSIRKIMNEGSGTQKNNANQPSTNAVNNILDTEEQIKSTLVKLALKNAGMAVADANIEIAEISRKKANSTLLSSVSIDANVNEFVISGSPSAAFYPKYNLGLSLPLDMFAKSKAEKNTANQAIIISKSQRDLVEANIKARVLIQYETYKEKKEQVELQKIAMEDDIAAYERAQKDFKEDVITMEELNKIYKASITEKSFLAAKEKELNIAIIQMEEIIGMPLQKALQK